MWGWGELGRLPRQVWLVNVTTLIHRVGSMAFIFLGLYLTKNLGYPTHVSGLLLTTYGVGAFLVTPFGGWLCDRLGSKQVTVYSLLLTGLMFMVFPFIKGLPMIFAATFVLSLVSEIFHPATLTMTTVGMSEELKKPAIALNRLAHNLGMSVGPALGGFLAAKSFAAIFWVDGITALIAAVVALIYLEPTQVESGEKPVSFFRNLTLLGQDKILLYFLLAGLPLGVAWFQFTSTVPIFLVKELGMTEFHYGLLFTINTLLIVLIEVPLNVKTAHWSPALTLSLAALLFAVGFGSLVFVKSFVSIAVFMVVISTFGEMLLSPAGTAYVSSISPKGREGSYMGVYGSAYSLCMLLAPAIGTWCYDLFGGRVLWTGTFVFGMVSAVLYTRIRKNRPQATETTTADDRLRA